MAQYHPPKIITNNAAPVLSADLSYESHGKCGCQTIILSDLGDGGTVWQSNNPEAQPVLVGCTDYSHVYKIVALSNVKFRVLEASNIADAQLNALIFGTGSFVFKMHSEIYANFTLINIISGTLMLYRDCEQS